MTGGFLLPYHRPVDPPVFFSVIGIPLLLSPPDEQTIAFLFPSVVVNPRLGFSLVVVITDAPFP